MQKNARQSGWRLGWLRHRWVAGIGVATMLLACVAISAIYYHGTIIARASELRLFRSSAMTLDERLTMSARLAAASGDLQWENNYRQAEAELNVILNRTGNLLNKLIGARVTQVQQDVLKTKRYNDALVAMENQCFERLRAGDRNGAAAAVMSAEYNRLKGLYADAVARSDAAIEQMVSDEISNNQRWAIVTSMLMAVFVCVAIGWTILAVQARHKAALAERIAAAEQALANLSAYKAALDQHNLVSVTDLDGSITEVNEALCRTSQYAREELIGANHRILNSGTHPKAFWKKMWRTIAGGGVWGAEVCDKAKDGTLFWMDTTIAPIRMGSGSITGYVSARVDITERKRSEMELLSAARARTSLRAWPTGR